MFSKDSNANMSVAVSLVDDMTQPSIIHFELVPFRGRSIRMKGKFETCYKMLISGEKRRVVRNGVRGSAYVE